MRFTVVGGSNNTGQSGNPLARHMQTLSERQQLLSGLPAGMPIETTDDELYNMIAAMPPGPQKVLAIAALHRELSSPSYWKGDQTPRDPHLASSSSWVNNINYDPIAQILTVNGYACPCSPRDAERVLNGKYYRTDNSVGGSVTNLWKDYGIGKFAGLEKKYAP